MLKQVYQTTNKLLIDGLNSFIFVIAKNVIYKYKTQQNHTKHKDYMALVNQTS